MAQRDWEKARRVPTELATEFAMVAAQSYEAWVKAREDSDFASFRPWLEKVLELPRRDIECFAPYDDPYDVVLDDFEAGMKTGEVRAIFALLESELVSLVASHAADEEDDFMRGPFAIDSQIALSREIIERFGATGISFASIHGAPFERSRSVGDIRLTMRYDKRDLNSLFTAMHECGHGLYEWGVSPSLERTPLCTGCSAALHESQSRLWENVVGRSLPFWRWFYPRVQETFREKLGDVSLERFHHAINRLGARSFGSRPTRRATASTSCCGSTSSRSSSPADLPSRTSRTRGTRGSRSSWESLFRTTRSGAPGLPLVGGSFGYFPTYLLGTVLSVQMWDKSAVLRSRNSRSGWSGGTSRTSTPGCARTSTRSAASSHQRRRSSAVGRPIHPRAKPPIPPAGEA